MADEWRPLWIEVHEAAKQYGMAMHCEPRLALDDALEAVLKSLLLDRLESRALLWAWWRTNDFSEGSPIAAKEASLLPHGFWVRFHFCESEPDWVAGEAQFHESEGEEESGWMREFGLASKIEVRPSTHTKVPWDLARLPTSKKLSTILRGRPPKWDWEGALCHLIGEAHSNPDGLPEGYGSQAKIADMLAEWFQRNSGIEPARSELTSRASRIQDALASFRKF